MREVDTNVARVRSRKLTLMALDSFHCFLSISPPAGSKRKVSSVELALEERSKERMKMENKLNTTQVKAAKMDALTQLAQKLVDHGDACDFPDAMKMASEMWEDM